MYEERETTLVYQRELPAGNKRLWNDFRWHNSIYEAITNSSAAYGSSRKATDDMPLVNIPKVFRYITPENQGWWSGKGKNFSASVPGERSNLLEVERIPALPEVVR